jgi:hypothetical protein
MIAENNPTLAEAILFTPSHLYYIFLVLLLSWKRGNIFCAPAYVRIL